MADYLKGDTYEEEGNLYLYNEATHEYKFVAKVCHPDTTTEEDHAIAKRLSDCWNSCDGLEDASHLNERIARLVERDANNSADWARLDELRAEIECLNLKVKMADRCIETTSKERDNAIAERDYYAETLTYSGGQYWSVKDTNRCVPAIVTERVTDVVDQRDNLFAILKRVEFAEAQGSITGVCPSCGADGPKHDSGCDLDRILKRCKR